jgi:hypothetical protein
MGDTPQKLTASQKKSGGPWLKNPKQARKGETIGGGFFVFRRGDGTNRIRPSMWPFEYASKEEAETQATALAMANPGYTFDVVQVVNKIVRIDGVAEAQSEAA